MRALPVLTNVAEEGAVVPARAAVEQVVEILPAMALAAFPGAALRGVGARSARRLALRAVAVAAAEGAGTTTAGRADVPGRGAALPGGLGVRAAVVRAARRISDRKTRYARSVRTDPTGTAEAVRARIAVFAAAHVVDGPGAAAEIPVHGRRTLDEAVDAVSLMADEPCGTASAGGAGAS